LLPPAPAGAIKHTIDYNVVSLEKNDTGYRMAESTHQQHSAWRTYRRLLSYVGQFSGAFVIAVAALFYTR